jgi:hypothetical protein
MSAVRRLTFILAIAATSLGVAAPTAAVSLYPVLVAPMALSPTGSGIISTRDGRIRCIVTSGLVGGDCFEDYAEGTVITVDVSATYDSEACEALSQACQSAFTTSLIVDAPGTIANYGFRKAKAHLVVKPVGPGSGSVSGTGGLQCPEGCDIYLNLGTAVTFVAQPGAGSTFSGWDADSPCGNGASLSCSFTAIDDVVIYPTFLLVAATPTPATSAPVTPTAAPTEASTRAPKTPAPTTASTPTSAPSAVTVPSTPLPSTPALASPIPTSAQSGPSPTPQPGAGRTVGPGPSSSALVIAAMGVLVGVWLTLRARRVYGARRTEA